MSALLRTRRIAWALSLFVATLALSYSYVFGSSYLRAVGWVEHTLTVQRTLESVLQAVVDQESGTRGYVITGDQAFLEQVTSGRSSFEASLTLTRNLVRDNPSQAERLRRLELVAREKLAFMERTVELRESGATAEVSALVASRQGKHLMDRMRVLVGEIEAEESRLFDERSRAAARSQRQTVVAITGGALVMVLLLAASFFTMQRDAAALRRAAEEIAESEERYRVLVENAHELVRLHAADGRPFFVSPSCGELLGYTAEECIAAPPFALVHPDDVGLAKYTLRRLQMGELKAGVVTYRLRRKDGVYRWFEFNIGRVNSPDGLLRHYQSAGRDVTLRRELEQRLAIQTEELRNLSLRDGLTGLYNRRGLLELSAQVVRVAERERHGLAVLFVDLDGLKRINDEFGHEQGDRAIAETGDLLRATCRATDVVARLGGDEFVVLVSKVDDESIEVLKRRLTQAVNEANQKPGRRYELAFSLGVAIAHAGSQVTVETLITEADTRMYEMKTARRQPSDRAAVGA